MQLASSNAIAIANFIEGTKELTGQVNLNLIEGTKELTGQVNLAT